MDPFNIEDLEYSTRSSEVENGSFMIKTPMMQTISYTMSYFVTFSFRIKYAKMVAHIGDMYKIQLLVESGINFKLPTFPDMPQKPTKVLKSKIGLSF